MLRAGWGAREPSWMEARRSGGTADYPERPAERGRCGLLLAQLVGFPAATRFCSARRARLSPSSAVRGRLVLPGTAASPALGVPRFSSLPGPNWAGA